MTGHPNLMARVSADTKQATRERLLEAAAREFARRGLERANIDAISLAAGYAKGTIYNYFASKEELFLAVVEEACAQATASASAPPQASARERLRATLAAFCAWAGANEGFARVLVRECLMGTPELQRTHGRGRGAAPGRARGDPPRRSARGESSRRLAARAARARRSPASPISRSPSTGPRTAQARRSTEIPELVLGLLLGARPAARPRRDRNRRRLIVGAGPPGSRSPPSSSASGRASGSSIASSTACTSRARSRCSRARSRCCAALGIAQTLVERGNDAVQLRMHFGAAGRRDAAVRHRARGHRLPVPALHLAGRDRGGPERAPRRTRRRRRAGRRAARVLGRRTTRSPARSATETERTRAGARPLPRRLRRRPQHRPPAAPGSRSTAAPTRRRSCSPTSRSTASSSPTPRTPSSARHGMLLFFPLGSPATWRMLGMRPTPAAGAGDLGDRRPRSPELQAICRRLHRRHAAAARPGLADLLPAPAPPGRPLPRRARLPRRRRRPRPQPGRRPGHEHRHPGRLEPRLEARPGRTRRAPTRRCSTPTSPSACPSGGSCSASPTAPPQSRPRTAASSASLRTQLAPRLAPSRSAFSQGPRARLPHDLAARDQLPETAPPSRRARAAAKWPESRRPAPRRPIVRRRSRILAPRSSRRARLPPAPLRARRRMVRRPNSTRSENATAVSSPSTGWHAKPATASCTTRAERRSSASASNTAAHYLVRPDGHIGYRSGGTQLLGADRYLSRWLSAEVAV